MPDDLGFVRSPTGAVHVKAPLRRRDLDPLDTGADLDTLTLLNLGVRRTRCGQRLRVHDLGGPEGCDDVSTFPDDALCTSCFRTLTVEEQEEAFAHPQPGDKVCGTPECEDYGEECSDHRCPECGIPPIPRQETPHA